VEYDIGFSKISLGLIAHQYGGKYFPKPPGLGGLLRIKEWVKPTLLVEADRNNDGVSDIEKSEAELIASHCEVRFRNAR